MIDLQNPLEEAIVVGLAAAGVVQTGFIAILIAFYQLDFAAPTPEFIVVAWVAAVFLTTVTFFVARIRGANQRPTDDHGETLVSGERGQAAVSPIALVLGAVVVITILFIAYVAGGMGLGPLVGAGFAVAFVVVFKLFVAVPLRGGRSE